MNARRFDTPGLSSQQRAQLAGAAEVMMAAGLREVRISKDLRGKIFGGDYRIEFIAEHDGTVVLRLFETVEINGEAIEGQALLLDDGRNDVR